MSFAKVRTSATPLCIDRLYERYPLANGEFAIILTNLARLNGIRAVDPDFRFDGIPLKLLAELRPPHHFSAEGLAELRLTFFWIQV